jgi:hypothetical protein
MLRRTFAQQMEGALFDHGKSFGNRFYGPTRESLQQVAF